MRLLFRYDLFFFDHTSHHHITINNNKHHDQVPNPPQWQFYFVKPFTLFSPEAFAKLILTFDWAFLIAKVSKFAFLDFLVILLATIF
jgi:hypothetical protein